MPLVIDGPTYRPARVIARVAHEYIARHLEQTRETNPRTAASVATIDAIEAVIDTAFRASLRREEGYIPRLSLAIIAPDEPGHTLMFEEALPLTPGSLARLSPAVARSRLHVGVWNVRDQLYAWGTVRSLPISSCVIEVAAPGLLVVKHCQSEQRRKLVNVAVLDGDQIKIVDERASRTADCPSLVSSLIGSEGTASPSSVDVLVELAVSMRGHGRGGALLVVPSDNELWRESIVHPLPYAVRPRFSALGDLARESGNRLNSHWEPDLRATVEMIAGLTAVDGATVITDQYELIAFGAKIARRDGHLRVEQVIVTEPIEDTAPVIVHPTQLGGTRHFSAVQFVHDQRDAMALVASQDGRFTIFSWSPSEDMVHAHRVESLLL